MAQRTDGETRPSITQYDLADHLGIGQKTVSRALAGDLRVAPALRARIDAAVKELGYRPNHSARSTRTRRFDSVLFIQVVAESHHRLTPGVIDGIADGLAAAGRPLVIERLVLSDLAAGGAGPRGLLHAMVDGLLVHVDAEPPAIVDTLLAASGLPVVWINRQQAADAICPDDAGVAALMVRRLVAAGHRRIAWFDRQIGFRDPQELHHSRPQRIAGFRTAMHEAGLPAMILSPGYDPGESGHPAWLEAQLRGALPSAIACYGSYEALAVQHAAGRLGIRIPEDLSLITVHHESLVAGVRIDVAALPTEALGRAAAAMLTRRISGQPAEPAIEVPCTLIPGATVTPPRTP